MDCFGYREARLALDKRENIYIAGSDEASGFIPISQPLPTQSVSGAYNQALNASTTDPRRSDDAFIIMFDPDNRRKWATYFGGGCLCNGSLSGSDGIEYATDIAVYKDQRLYLTGVTHGAKTTL